MKENEIPERIYISLIPSISGGHVYTTVNKDFPNAVEYTSTDAFIEKALKWYCLDCECNDNCKDTKCFFHNEYKRFLEGKENACLPKFEYTILNPDGSTSDNWRHRHFIRKMQDAFIEKAEKYIRSIADGLDRDDDVEAFISGFRKYMEGE